MKKTYVNENFPHLLHGGDYNPEQWIDVKEEIWNADMRLMKEANCNEMTVGIFSWAKLEPREGEYDFSFLEEIIEKIHANGGKVILATPTGSRPRWMAEKYPEVCRVNGVGQRTKFDDRHNHCFTSPVYREKMRAINTRLAQKFGNHPAVIGWHLSNEYGGECHCELCQNEFRKYLRKKYDNDIEKLNKAYWATFWSHSFNNFEEIYAPSPLTDSRLHGLNIDWRRFVTYQTVDFMKAEKAAVREGGSQLPVTTNLMAWFEPLDYYKMAEELDFISWDAYPDWHLKDNEIVAAETGFMHDLYRTMKRKPFLLMESAPGLLNWKGVNNLKKPGVDTLQSLQTIAHGGDSVGYFQWRKSRGSLEKFHGAVIDHVGTNETRVFKAVQETGRRLKNIDEIAGTGVISKAAVIFDWENLWAVSGAMAYKSNKFYSRTCREYYQALWKNAVSVDIVNAHADLSSYDLVIAPMLYMADQDTIDRLENFVKNGGTLYATYTLATVDGTDLCHLGGLPAGKLKEVFGIWNEEIDALPDGQFGGVQMNGKEYQAIDMCELIHAKGAKVLAEYSKDFYQGMPALTCNDYGKGRAYYQTFRDTGDFKNQVLTEILKQMQMQTAIPVPENGLPYGITAHKRTDGETEYLFVENYAEEGVKDIELGSKWQDMETGEICDKISLDKYSLSVLKRKI